MTSEPKLLRIHAYFLYKNCPFRLDRLITEKVDFRRTWNLNFRFFCWDAISAFLKRNWSSLVCCCMWRVELLPGGPNEPCGISVRPCHCHLQPPSHIVVCSAFEHVMAELFRFDCFNEMMSSHLSSFLRQTENSKNQTSPLSLQICLCCTTGADRQSGPV